MRLDARGISIGTTITIDHEGMKRVVRRGMAIKHGGGRDRRRTTMEMVVSSGGLVATGHPGVSSRSRHRSPDRFHDRFHPLILKTSVTVGNAALTAPSLSPKILDAEDVEITTEREVEGSS